MNLTDHLTVPNPPGMQCRSQYVNVWPAQTLLDLCLQTSAHVVLAFCDQTLLDVLCHILQTDILYTSVQLFETEVDIALAEDSIQGLVDLLPCLIQEHPGVYSPCRLEILDDQSLGAAVGVHIGRCFAHAISLAVCFGRAVVGA